MGTKPPRDRGELGMLLYRRRLKLGEDRTYEMGLTEAGKLIGVDDSTYGRWEKGQRLPDSEFFPGVAAFLKISLAELLAVVQRSREAKRAAKPSPAPSGREAKVKQAVEQGRRAAEERRALKRAVQPKRKSS